MEQDVEQGGAGPAAMEETSLEFLGQWQRLVSTTNWEKGRIICLWRQALIDSSADWQEYSDEAWSRRVGNVSGQHVGRLRRVYERFGEPRETYPGLYWSHFQAAMDWPDAELDPARAHYSVPALLYWPSLGRAPLYVRLSARSLLVAS